MFLGSIPPKRIRNSNTLISVPVLTTLTHTRHHTPDTRDTLSKLKCPSHELNLGRKIKIDNYIQGETVLKFKNLKGLKLKLFQRGIGFKWN